MTSQVTVANARYSPSADECETLCYFFNFHEIKDLRRKTQKPLNEGQVSGQDPQFASTKAFIDKASVLDKKIPWPEDPLMYLNRWFAAFIWVLSGCAMN